MSIIIINIFFFSFIFWGHILPKRKLWVSWRINPPRLHPRPPSTRVVRRSAYRSLDRLDCFSVFSRSKTKTRSILIDVKARKEHTHTSHTPSPQRSVDVKPIRFSTGPESSRHNVLTPRTLNVFGDHNNKTYYTNTWRPTNASYWKKRWEREIVRVPRARGSRVRFSSEPFDCLRNAPTFCSCFLVRSSSVGVRLKSDYWNRNVFTPRRPIDKKKKKT